MDTPTSLVLTLDPPVKWADQEFTQLTLDEPTVDEWEKASKASGMASNILLLSLVATRCAGRAVSESVIRKIKQGELLRALDFFEVCMATSRKLPGTDTDGLSLNSPGTGAA